MKVFLLLFTETTYSKYTYYTIEISKGNVEETKEKERKKEKKQNARVVNELPLSGFETMEIPLLVLFVDNVFY